MATKHVRATVLRNAANLLETKGWTQGLYARDSEGHGCPADSPDAVCFCAWGSIRAQIAITDSTVNLVRYDLVDFTKESITEWNDKKDQTKENVIATMRACADNLEKGQLK